MEKQQVLDLLKSHVCVIEFEKADGSNRVMLGTLLDAFITIESAGSSVPKDNLVVLWDCEKEGWRSFRLDRLKAIRQASEEELAMIA